MNHKDYQMADEFGFKKATPPQKAAGKLGKGSMKVSADMGDKTGWGGNADPSISMGGSHNDMQSPGYDQAQVESKGHTQEKSKRAADGKVSSKGVHNYNDDYKKV